MDQGWVWENYWLIFSSTAYLICPWILALATIPRLFDVYARVSIGSLASVAIYGIGWGFGALTFGLGVEALGLALGFAIILGVAATAGTLVPLLVQPPQGFSLAQGAMTAVSLDRDGRRRGDLLLVRSMEGNGERRGEIVQARPCDRYCFRTSLILRKPRVLSSDPKSHSGPNNSECRRP